MPNACGTILNTDVRRMRELRPTHTLREIAFEIGCSRTAAWRHLGGLPRATRPSQRVASATNAMRERAERYAAFVERASAYVPTIGGARA